MFFYFIVKRKNIIKLNNLNRLFYQIKMENNLNNEEYEKIIEG